MEDLTMNEWLIVCSPLLLSSVLIMALQMIRIRNGETPRVLYSTILLIGGLNILAVLICRRWPTLFVSIPIGGIMFFILHLIDKKLTVFFRKRDLSEDARITEDLKECGFYDDSLSSTERYNTIMKKLDK